MPLISTIFLNRHFHFPFTLQSINRKVPVHVFFPPLRHLNISSSQLTGSEKLKFEKSSVERCKIVNAPCRYLTSCLKSHVITANACRRNDKAAPCIWFQWTFHEQLICSQFTVLHHPFLFHCYLFIFPLIDSHLHS